MKHRNTGKVQIVAQCFFFVSTGVCEYLNYEVNAHNKYHSKCLTK